jgi:hypothetical protein
VKCVRKEVLFVCRYTAIPANRAGGFLGRPESRHKLLFNATLDYQLPVSEQLLSDLEVLVEN